MKFKVVGALTHRKDRWLEMMHTEKTGTDVVHAFIEGGLYWWWSTMCE